MTARQPKVQTQLDRAAIQIFAANDRINQLLIEHLDPAARNGDDDKQYILRLIGRE